MNIRTKQEAVTWMVGLGSLIRNDMRRLQHLFGCRAGNCTPPLVERQKALAKLILATPGNNRSSYAFPRVFNVSRIEPNLGCRLVLSYDICYTGLCETALDHVRVPCTRQTPNLL